MELTVLHLFPDFMSLYGEYANVAVLRRYLERMGVSVTLRAVSCDDPPDFGGADLIYMGAGTERKLKTALEKLLPHGDSLKAAAARGALVLFTGNAMTALGASVTDAGGKVWPGLGLADFTTVESDKRTPEDVIAAPVLWDAPAVGFMNKCSVTHGVSTPLFGRLLLGFGNEAERGAEGYVSENVFGTHITGPALVKNPDFLDFIVRRLFQQKGRAYAGPPPALPHQREAYEITLQELKARAEN